MGIFGERFISVDDVCSGSFLAKFYDDEASKKSKSRRREQEAFFVHRQWRCFKNMVKYNTTSQGDDVLTFNAGFEERLLLLNADFRRRVCCCAR